MPLNKIMGDLIVALILASTLPKEISNCLLVRNVPTSAFKNIQRLLLLVGKI